MDTKEIAVTVTKPSYGWEHLITEGHVRAARLRRVAPYTIALGIALVVIGVYGFIHLSTQTGVSGIDLQQSLQGKVRDYRHPVLKKIEAMRIDREFTEDQILQIATEEKLSKAVQKIMASLEEKDALPSDDFQTLKPEEFWGKSWPTDVPVTTALTVKKENVLAVGAIVNIGDERYSTQKLWIGLFKKSDDKAWGLLNSVFPENKGKWQFASLKAGNFYVLPDKPFVTPDEVTVSLRQLMEIEEVK